MRPSIVLKRLSSTARFALLVSFVGLLGGLLSSTSALAHGGPRGDREPPTWEDTLERADADGDGRISADEFRGPDRRFGRLDADGDGYVTETEAAEARASFENARQGRRHKHRARKVHRAMLKAADANDDREITRAEWSSFLAASDLDSDGLLQGTEIRTALEAEREAEDAGREVAIEDLEARFDEIDRNDDGVVSKDDRPDRRDRRRDRRRG